MSFVISCKNRSTTADISSSPKLLVHMRRSSPDILQYATENTRGLRPNYARNTKDPNSNAIDLCDEIMNSVTVLEDEADVQDI